MPFEEKFKSVVLEYIRSNVDDKATAILSIDSATRSGGCETCYFEYAIVEIRYDVPGSRYGRTYDYDGDFLTFMSALYAIGAEMDGD